MDTGRTPPNFLTPLLLLAIAVVLSMAAATNQVLRQRQALANAATQQAAAISEGDKLRKQIDGLLAGATALASNGNAPARTALDVLARQGINYTAQPPPK